MHTPNFDCDATVSSLKFGKEERQKKNKAIRIFFRKSFLLLYLKYFLVSFSSHATSFALQARLKNTSCHIFLLDNLRCQLSGEFKKCIVISPPTRFRVLKTFFEILTFVFIPLSYIPCFRPTFRCNYHAYHQFVEA